MTACLDPETNIVTIAHDIAGGLAGFEGGYSVQLHGLPKYSFNVQADTADRAHALALKTAQSEGKCLKVTGATIQAR